MIVEDLQVGKVLATWRLSEARFKYELVDGVWELRRLVEHQLRLTILLIGLEGVKVKGLENLPVKLAWD